MSSDLISRQAVNDAIEDWWISDDSDKRDLIKRLHKRIDDLPSVNPQEPKYGKSGTRTRRNNEDPG